MRVYALYGLVIFLAIWMHRDWAVGAAGLIILTTLRKYGDMPRSLFNVTGLSIDNLLMLALTATLFFRHGSDHVFKRLPRLAQGLLIAYLFLIVSAGLRGLFDLGSLKGPYQVEFGSPVDFGMEFLANPIKYLVPAALVFAGVRNRYQVRVVLGGIALAALIYALLVIRWMPPATLLDEATYMELRPRIERETGLHANDMALVLVQAFWCFALYLRVSKSNLHRAITVLAGGALLYAILLCQSRGGFMAMAVAGLVIGVVYWRRLLFVIPPLVIALLIAFPTLSSRLETGIGVADSSGQASTNWGNVSAGRLDVLWPAALTQIEQQPIIGEGRLTIVRTNMYYPIEAGEGMCPSHPHNAYLEMMCDGGIIALSIVVFGLVTLWAGAARLSRRGGDPEVRMIGAMALALTSAYIVAGLSGQSFWPREATVLFSCMVALFLRTMISAKDWRIRTKPAPRQAMRHAFATPRQW